MFWVAVSTRAGDWAVATNAVGSVRVWDVATATERFSWGLQNYTFMLQRSQTERAATLSILRGNGLLREAQLPLRSGARLISLVVVKVNDCKSKSTSIHRWFFKISFLRAVERGVWGLLLDNTHLDQLIVRRSIAVESENALQQGDEYFRRGQFTGLLLTPISNNWQTLPPSVTAVRKKKRR